MILICELQICKFAVADHGLSGRAAPMIRSEQSGKKIGYVARPSRRLPSRSSISATSNPFSARNSTSHSAGVRHRTVDWAKITSPNAPRADEIDRRHTLHVKDHPQGNGPISPLEHTAEPSCQRGGRRHDHTIRFSITSYTLNRSAGLAPCPSTQRHKNRCCVMSTTTASGDKTLARQR